MIAKAIQKTPSSERENETESETKKTSDRLQKNMLKRASKLTLICASFAKGGNKSLINFKGLDRRGLRLNHWQLSAGGANTMDTVAEELDTL